MILKKPAFIFITLLAAVSAAGWWTGVSKATALHSSASAERQAPARGADTSSGSGGPESGDDFSRTSHLAAMTGAEAVAELQSIYAKLKSLEENAHGGEQQMMMAGIWSMGRAVCLIQKLSAEEKTAFLNSLPKEDAQEISMFLLGAGAFLGGAKDKTAEDFKKDLAEEKGADGDTAFITLMSWASRDAEGMMDYWRQEVSKPVPPDWALKNMGTIFGQINWDNCRLALRTVLKIENEKIRQDALRHIYPTGLFKGAKSGWSEDATSLVQEQLSFVAPEDRQGVLTSALRGRLGSETPEESMAWISSLNLGPDATSWTDTALVQAWRERHPAEAGNWRLQHTPADRKPAAVEEMVKWWTRADMDPQQRLQLPEPDLAGCADWILSLGISPDTEKGISRLADAWIDAGEPAAAIAWAKAIPDAGARQTSLTNVTTQIRRRYPDTWRAMLAAAGEPDPPAAAPDH